MKCVSLYAESQMQQMEMVEVCCVLAVQEFQKDNKNVVISETEMKQTVYIYKCENSTIQVKGKVNAITVGQLIFL